MPYDPGYGRSQSWQQGYGQPLPPSLSSPPPPPQQQQQHQGQFQSPFQPQYGQSVQGQQPQVHPSSLGYLLQNMQVGINPAISRQPPTVAPAPLYNDNNVPPFPPQNAHQHFQHFAAGYGQQHDLPQQPLPRPLDNRHALQPHPVQGHLHHHQQQTYHSQSSSPPQPVPHSFRQPSVPTTRPQVAAGAYVTPQKRPDASYSPSFRQQQQPMVQVRQPQPTVHQPSAYVHVQQQPTEQRQERPRSGSNHPSSSISLPRQDLAAVTPLPPQNVNTRPPSHLNAPQRSPQESSKASAAVAYVRIPSQPTTATTQHAGMPAPSKRRKSNDGAPTAVHNASPRMSRDTDAMLVSAATLRQDQTKLRPHAPQPLPSSSPLTELASSQIPATPPPPKVDYQTLLLGLADEYIDAAHSMASSSDANEWTEGQVYEYGALISTGMGCLESIIANFRSSDPRREARIRLRFATLLHEETENGMQAEEVLSKGIALCERGHLTDPKYAMHHLLARIVFKSKPKAALKAVEKLVAEVEALGHTHWMYMFRLLRVTLGLESLGRRDTAAALKHLAAVVATAEKAGCIPVQILASLLEAVVHLRSESPESVVNADRALTAVQKHQLSPVMKVMPQARILLDVLALACTLVAYSPEKALAKMELMQQDLDPLSKEAAWAKDGTFIVDLGMRAREGISEDTCGLMQVTQNGAVGLFCQWLPINDLYALAYWLSSIASFHKDTQDGKALKYADQAFKCTSLKQDVGIMSMNHSVRRSKAVMEMRTLICLHIALVGANRADWTAVDSQLTKIQKSLKTVRSEPDYIMKRLILYLKGTRAQGCGDLGVALEIFSCPPLAFDASSKEPAYVKDICAIAGLNSVLIMRTQPEKQSESEMLLAQLEPYCAGHVNKSLISAFQVIKSFVSAPSVPMIKTKQYIQAALQAAQPVANQQLLSIIMNTMTDLFFANIVGEQAVKSANAGRTLAKKAGDKLWMAVAGGMCGNTLELCGRSDLAESARTEGSVAWASVNDGLKRKLEELR